jgi:hypothetical protein
LMAVSVCLVLMFINIHDDASAVCNRMVGGSAGRLLRVCTNDAELETVNAEVVW